MKFLEKLMGDPNVKVIKKIEPIVAAINGLTEEYHALSDEQIKKKSDEFRERLKKGETLDDILPEAFATVREAAQRTLKQFHYDVQLVGGVILHRGHIAEMKTGEGKTLTSTLPVYLNAIEGKGVHIVTVNDYLAKRDAVWMGQIYHALGLSVGVIQHQASFRYDPDFQVEEEDTEEESGIHEGTVEDKERDTRGVYRVEMSFLRPVERKEAYNADITFGTNNEFGFDYLRDNMVVRLEDKVQRDLNYAIIDEVDSILIDEARTPLIISAPAEESTQMYSRFAELARGLVKEQDYNVDEKMRASTFTEEGQEKVATLLGKDPWIESDIKTVHHLEQALRAEALYHLDTEYVVREDQIIIVDEFTGRLMPGRRYSEGLHQAIEAKEGVQVQRESRTLATITFQNLFRMYTKLAGMTGTAATEAEEFGKIYNLEVTEIPTNKPIIRNDRVDKIYKTLEAKHNAIIADIKERQNRGQPVLMGTVSIEKNEVLSELLTKNNIPHAMLNAKQHESEGEIIAQAGRKGSVTVATNMAGRGVDIILGGNPPDKNALEEVKKLGGLYVIGTERHESRRIDNQLRGRSGRQGDAGESQFYVSLDDNLMRVFASERVRGMMDALKLPEDMPIENRMVAKSIESAQKKVEGHHFDTRKHLLEYDDVLNKHRETIYSKRQEILKQGSVDSTEEALKGLKKMIMEMVVDELEIVIAFHTHAQETVEDAPKKEKGDWNIKEIFEVANTIFPVSPDTVKRFLPPPKKGESKLGDVELRTEMLDALEEDALKAMEALEKQISNPETMREIFRGVTLRSIDMLWIEHLEAMDHLRQGIGLRGYGQRDPLVEYKRESFVMFRNLNEQIQKQIVYSIFRVGQSAVMAQKQNLMQSPRNMTLSGAAKTSDEASTTTTSGAGIAKEKVGRNDPCPCGSGKKYKKCHGS